MIQTMEKKQNIPELRFPEFEGEWENILFGKLYQFKPTNSFSREYLNYENGEVKNIHYGDIHTKFQTLFNILEEDVPFINPNVSLDKIPEENYCQEGDLVIADASEDYNDIGKSIELVNLYNEKILAGLHTFIARPDKTIIAKGFGGYIMKSPSVRQQIKIIAQGTKVLGISATRLAKMNLLFPSLPEQQRIASFLTAVDEKLTALKKKKALLEQYKKGVMQKIFSQEIRFKIENEAGELVEPPKWKKKKIGDYINVISGIALKGNEILEERIGNPILRGINISEGFIRHNKEIDRFYNGDVEKVKRFLLKENDLVIGMDGSKVGKNSSLISKNDVGSILIQRVARLRANKYSNIKFLFQIINSIVFHKYVDMVNTSSGIPHISLKQINDFKITIPCLEEQTKIANFLSSIDQKINQCQQQIEQTTQWKKGLLQKMFV